jgi:hypothetical protein
VEVQADTEHQEDDADFGELLGDVDIAGKPWGVRPDRDPGQQVPDNGRKAQSLGDQAQDPRRGEGGGDGVQEWELVHCEE